MFAKNLKDKAYRKFITRLFRQTRFLARFAGKLCFRAKRNDWQPHFSSDFIRVINDGALEIQRKKLYVYRVNSDRESKQSKIFDYLTQTPIINNYAMNITQKFKVKTDAGGAYSTEETVNPPGPFGFTVAIKAKLVAPEATTIKGTLDINGAGGSPQNDSRDFSVKTGEEAKLGKWKLAGGDNIIKVSGQTFPARANAQLEIEMVAEI